MISFFLTDVNKNAWKPGAYKIFIFYRFKNEFLHQNFITMHKSQFILVLSLAFLFMSFTKPGFFKKNEVFVYIPSGETMVNKEDKISMQGFFMAATEVTNKQYKLFLSDLENNGKNDLLAKAEINNDQWSTLKGFLEPMAANYSSHPAYDDYPVVNVSYAAAQLYCDWLTEKFNTYMEGSQIEVRLPSPLEWTYAARGGRELTPYPWGGYYVQNSKGCYLANFSPQDEVNDDGGLFMVVADAYFPNDFGLYNTSGNVAEMTNEKGIAMGGSWQTQSHEEITVESKSTYQGASPTLGFRPVVTISGGNQEVNLNKVWKKITKEIGRIG